MQTKDASQAMDTDVNGIFGLFLVLWATCFVESWKRKQNIIQHYWDCSENSFSSQDERTDDFLFYMDYNENTD